MTTLFNLCSLATALICGFFGYRLRKNYEEIKIESLKSFSNAYFSLASAFLILFFPQLILFDSFWIQIDFILVDLSFLRAILFAIPSIFSLSEKFSRFEKIPSWFISSWMVVFVVLSIFFFSPAIPLMENETIYYWKTGISWLHSITGGLLCLETFLVVIFFLFWARKVQKKILFWRSILIGLSSLMIGIGGIIFYFFPWIYFSPKMLILSSFLVFSGFSLGTFAILFFQPFKEKWVRKIT